MKTVAVIPAAGAGVRMGTELAKQFLELEGRPLLAVTLEKFQACGAVDGIVLVVPEDRVAYCKQEILAPYGLTKVRAVVAGGKRRQDSVKRGLDSTGGGFELVLIHDGVRPFVQPELIDRILRAAEGCRAVVPASPLKETLKEIEEGGRVLRTLERRALRLVQTPQAFRYDDLVTAHRLAAEENWEEMTDDAHLLERMGIPVTVIEGSEENIKVTTPYDLELARFILRKRKA